MQYLYVVIDIHYCIEYLLSIFIIKILYLIVVFIDCIIFIC